MYVVLQSLFHQVIGFGLHLVVHVFDVLVRLWLIPFQEDSLLRSVTSIDHSFVGDRLADVVAEA